MGGEIRLKNKNMENKESRRYVVVTPCRTEEKNLPDLVQSITAQTLRPALWMTAAQIKQGK